MPAAAYARPLVLPATALDAISTPFAGDLLGRQALAERLTTYLDRLRDGAVLAIDAPWGEGKTWFGRHWAKQLEQQGHPVAVIDAFGQDYAEDAFLLLASAIVGLRKAESGVTATLKHRAGAVLRALLPVGTKALVNLAGRALGTSDLVDKFDEALGEATEQAIEKAAENASEKAADAAGAWVKGRLDQWEAEQKTVQHFREALTAFAAATFAETDKPTVILIDELDRCRPAFAVQLVERIKHFFDVPHLVFVLLMNRDQLEKAIRGVYGAETDAATYLGKFLHLSLRLPTARNVLSDGATLGLTAYVLDALKRIGAGESEFARDFAMCAALFDLSARDVERGCTLYSLATTDASPPSTALLAYCIALKLKHPDLYFGLREGRSQAHVTCMNQLCVLLDGLLNSDPFGTGAADDASRVTIYQQALRSLHHQWLTKHAPDVAGALRDTTVHDEAYRAHFIHVRDVQAFLQKTLRRLDLTIE